VLCDWPGKLFLNVVDKHAPLPTKRVLSRVELPVDGSKLHINSSFSL